MKILHVGPDSPFTQYLGSQFEAAAPGSNVFAMVSADKSVRHAVVGAKNFAVNPRALSGFSGVLRVARGCDALIAHGLLREATLLFVLLKTPLKIWSGWGFDYYVTGAGDKYPFLGSLTKVYAESSAFGKASLKKIKGLPFAWLKRRAVAEVDYFSAPIPDDFDVMLRAYPAFSGKYIQLNYGDVATMFSAGAEDSAGLNVLVGNSASQTNNHQEVFEKLALSELDGRQIIVPLSYGDADYREHVIKLGERYFGDRFVPLVEFIPLPDYVKIIASCNVVLMGHKRQQALGNIGSAIYHGAHVHLDVDCPTYRFLMDRGIEVTPLDRLDKYLPTTRVADDVLANQRVGLFSFWGADVVADNVQRCISLIRENSSKRMAGI